MVFLCAVGMLYTLFLSLAQCSGIITKSMIRMPNGSFSGFSRTLTPPSSQLPKPEMLRSSQYDSELHAAHSLKPEKDEKISIENPISHTNTSFDPTIVENFVPLDTPTAFSDTNIPPYKNNDPKIIERKDTIKTEDRQENLNATMSPKELSSKYWMHFNNFFHDFFNKWSHQENPKNESKKRDRYPDSSILEMIQRIFSCFWNSELFSCVYEGFGDASLENFSFFHLISSRLPRLQMKGGVEEDFTSRNDEFEYSIVEEDEGRKKLSKRLQQLIPFLMMLKMTMLPALAVMALVSGKAFLMSLLSLGVALVATFSSAVPFSADKRHEIAPLSPTHTHGNPTEQLPGKYYYVM